MANLVADIGGTNARFGLWDTEWRASGKQSPPKQRKLFSYQRISLSGAGDKEYCQQQALQPQHLSLAVARAVEKDWVPMGNNNWSFSKADLKDSLRLDSLTVINDFTAQRCCRHHTWRGRKTAYTQR